MARPVVVPWPRSEPQDAARVLLQTRAGANEDGEAMLAGLLERPARISPKYFYDAQGRALFGAICRLNEYLPAVLEAAVFVAEEAAIAAELPLNCQWIDLGCGDCSKSLSWLRAAGARRFIGVDAAEGWLRPALRRVAAEHNGIEAVGVVTDLTQDWSLHALLAERPHWPPVFFYAGSSIGNFEPDAALRLLGTIERHCRDSGGRLLIGVDLVKDKALLEAGYNDALGVTAAFNRNVLRVANRALAADFVLSDFTHVAFFNAREQRIEMHLMSSRTQCVRFGSPPHTERLFEAGETIVTEYCYKFHPLQFSKLLAQAGFSRQRLWTDPSMGYGVFLAAP